jgi:hypothetical protein
MYNAGMEGNGKTPHHPWENREAPSCPGCGAKKWSGADDVESVVLQVTDRSGHIVPLTEGGGGIPAMPIICLECGFISLHSRSVLGGDLDASG